MGFRAQGLGFRVSGLYNPLIIEKQMEENMENEMKTGGIGGCKEPNLSYHIGDSSANCRAGFPNLGVPRWGVLEPLNSAVRLALCIFGFPQVDCPWPMKFGVAGS